MSGFDDVLEGWTGSRFWDGGMSGLCLGWGSGVGMGILRGTRH